MGAAVPRLQAPLPLFSFHSAGSCFMLPRKDRAGQAGPDKLDLDGLTQGMKPAFALSLSAEGIALHFRAPDGWRSVADTPFDTPDLPATLGDMRDLAAQLAPDGIHSKLVLPDDQIRYLTVETGPLSDADRIEAARAALEGATPYAVDELAFDIFADAAQTHVAAVALETLDEAETFAVEHGFGPVSFVAAPDAKAFPAEPFFGTTRAIRGTEVEPDTAAIKVIGPVTLPVAATAEEPPAEPAADTPAADTPAVDPAPANAESAETAGDNGPPDKAATPTPAPAAEPKAAGTPKGELAPTADAKTQPSSATAPHEPEPAKAPVQDKTAATTAQSAASDSPKQATQSKTAADKASESAAIPPAPQVAPSDTSSPRPVPPAPIEAGSFASRRSRGAGVASKNAPAAAVPVSPPTPEPKPQDGPKIAALTADTGSPTPTVPPAPAALRSQAAAVAAPDAAAATKTMGGKPRFLGVILTAFLLLFMATVAVWAVLGDSNWLSYSPADETPLAPAPAVSTEEPLQDADTPAETTTPQPDVQPPSLEPAAIAPQVSALPDQPDPGVQDILPQPAEGGETDLAESKEPQSNLVQSELEPTDPAPSDLTNIAEAEHAPSIEDEAEADGVDLPEEGTDTAFLDPATRLPGQQTAEQADPDLPLLEPAPDTQDLADTGALSDNVQPAPDQPETADNGTTPDTETVADDEPQDPLEQAARYAATGVWTTPPELTEPTASLSGVDTLYAASIDHTDSAIDAIALPPAASFATDSEPDFVASPAAHGETFDLDERGLVKATPEGTLTPDGVMVFLGSPKIIPPAAPNRNDTEAEALAESIARDQLLSRLRPKPRPADLEERIERAQLGGLSREELARIRPRPRPPSLKPANENQLPVTAQAVPTSVKPRARPANFANLVDRAQRNSLNTTRTAAAATPAAAAAAPAATAPRIPTTASVARRATVSGAINLRNLNLIGIYGTASNRSALIRLPSGRYRKVQVGDRIDGGRVIAIGESQLQYQKSGRNRTLTMPKG